MLRYWKLIWGDEGESIASSREINRLNTSFLELENLISSALLIFFVIPQLFTIFANQFPQASDSPCPQYQPFIIHTRFPGFITPLRINNCVTWIPQQIQNHNSQDVCWNVKKKFRKCIKFQDTYFPSQYNPPVSIQESHKKIIIIGT